MDPLSPQLRREVVSFVRRSARMNESQKRAWERFANRYILDLPRAEKSTSVALGTNIDWDQEFGRTAPLIVEIGSGAGDSLAPMAAHRSEANIVAFEVFEPAVASTLGRLGRGNIDNVRLVIADGANGLAALFNDETISELWTFFADPWHKKRHHKRRLVSRGFAALVATKLAPGGLWRLATDWEEYARWMRDELDAVDTLTNVHEDFAPRFAERPVTKYEARGVAAGRQIYDLTYRRGDATAN